MKMKIFLFFILSVTFVSNGFAQSKSKKQSSTSKQTQAPVVKELQPLQYTNSKIVWIPFEEAIERSKKDDRPIMIDLYTDWCGYCKRMDALTFSDTSVISYINSHFYAVKFDAESIQKITYRDTVYTNSKYVPEQKKTAHDLAAFLTNNNLVYPTIIFLAESKNILAPVPGFQTRESIQPLMFYFGEQVYLHSNLWEAFLKGYNAPKF